MIKNLYYRTLAVATIITSILFVFSLPEASNSTSWLLWGCGFFFLTAVMYKSFKDLSTERINEILALDFFKKIGCDFSEE